jgi:predicted FMN-binding regulatory protein PaiB
MSELGDAGVARRLPFIIGFEISVTSLEAKFQMSQYERIGDTREAIEVLAEEGDSPLADVMLRCNRQRVAEGKDEQ